MSITYILICLSSILFLPLGNSTPPSVCFESFNGLDCGGSPIHMLYYYKPGSRCEVGIWRGCPTQNKFQDEYECINTCIFKERARREEHPDVGNEDNYHLEYVEDETAVKEPAATTIVADSGYEADDEGEGNAAGEKEINGSEGEEIADVENAATENTDGENTDNENADDGKIPADADKENAADEADKETGAGDDETKIEEPEGTQELGSEDIGAN